MPEVEIRFRTDAEYRRLRAIRDKYGVQWRGMLIQGAKRLEGRDIEFEPSDEGLDLDRNSGQSVQNAKQRTGSHPQYNENSDLLDVESGENSKESEREDQFAFDTHGSLCIPDPRSESEGSSSGDVEDWRSER